MWLKWLKIIKETFQHTVGKQDICFEQKGFVHGHTDT